ncbi:hypothetical protein LIA77_01968 [Sarocladium implicatum]|nr:hypothetical protein LIA77_01968 [Sarocladium implicatum]
MESAGYPSTSSLMTLVQSNFPPSSPFTASSFTPSSKELPSTARSLPTRRLTPHHHRPFSCDPLTSSKSPIQHFCTTGSSISWRSFQSDSAARQGFLVGNVDFQPPSSWFLRPGKKAMKKGQGYACRAATVLETHGASTNTTS